MEVEVLIVQIEDITAINCGPPGGGGLLGEWVVKVTGGVNPSLRSKLGVWIWIWIIIANLLTDVSAMECARLQA